MKNNHLPVILIVDDQSFFRLYLKTLLGSAFLVLEAGNQKECMTLLSEHPVDLVLLDLCMPDVTDYGLLETLKNRYPHLSIIIVSGMDVVDGIVKCIQKGARDYVFKDDLKHNPLLLAQRVTDCIGKDRIARQAEAVVETCKAQSTIFLPAYAPLQRVYDMALKAVRGGLSLVIYGETGVGKGTLAAYIAHSLFPDDAFVQVNCGAIVESLAQAELFGYQKGAFTDAVDSRKGKFCLADKGVLFLDEVTNLSLSVQEILLTALEQRKICPVGAECDIPVSFQLITASNRSLQDAVAAKTFREDLFYRIGQFSVTLPPLREHPDLILAYAEYYISVYTRLYKTDFEMTSELRRFFLEQEWKGNVRELKHEVQNMVALYSQGDRDYLHEKLQKWHVMRPNSLGSRIDSLEREVLCRALRDTQGNLAATARQLNIPRSTLQGKLRKYDLYPTAKKAIS